jgi:hypothetical protein
MNGKSSCKEVFFREPGQVRAGRNTFNEVLPGTVSVNGCAKSLVASVYQISIKTGDWRLSTSQGPTSIQRGPLPLAMRGYRIFNPVPLG